LSLGKRYGGKGESEYEKTVGVNCFLTLAERIPERLGMSLKRRIEEIENRGRIVNFATVHKILNDEIEKLKEK